MRATATIKRRSRLAELETMRRARINAGCTTAQVMAQTGATYRQLDYWARTGQVPGQAPGSAIGSGNRRRWTDDDVARVELLMLAAFIKTRRLDEIVELMQRSTLIVDAFQLALAERLPPPDLSTRALLPTPS